MIHHSRFMIGRLTPSNWMFWVHNIHQVFVCGTPSSSILAHVNLDCAPRITFFCSFSLSKISGYRISEASIEKADGFSPLPRHHDHPIMIHTHNNDHSTRDTHKGSKESKQGKVSATCDRQRHAGQQTAATHLERQALHLLLAHHRHSPADATARRRRRRRRVSAAGPRERQRRSLRRPGTASICAM